MFDEVESNGSTRAIYRFKEIFKYQYIIIYIITLFISGISIKNGFFAFGLAMVAACVGEEIPVVVTYLCALIGTAARGGIAEAQTFFVASLIYFALVLLLRRKEATIERNEQIKTGGKLFAAGVIISIIRWKFGSFDFSMALEYVLSYGIMYAFYKVFVNGVQLIKSLGEKDAYTIEEIVATSIIFAIFYSICQDAYIFGLNLYYIALFITVMYVGWTYGIVKGAVCGISISVSLLLIFPISLAHAELLFVFGVLAGILSYLGKFSVVGFLILAGLCFQFTNIDEGTAIEEYLAEGCLACIALLFMTNRARIDFRKILNRIVYIGTEGGRWLREYREPEDKQKKVSDMLLALKRPQTRSEMENFEAFLRDFLDNIEKIDDNMFYDIVSDEDTEIARDICRQTKANNIIIENEMAEIFNLHNNYVFMKDEKTKYDLQEIVKIANRTWKEYKDRHPEVLYQDREEEEVPENKPFVLQVGNARHIMDGQNFSTDLSIQIKLKDGKYMLAFASNDVKTEDIRNQNKSILRKVKAELQNGFDKTKTFPIFQSEMNEDILKDSRLDIMVLDMQNGEIYIISNNNTNIYLKNLKTIKDLRKNADTLSLREYKVSNGDVLVMTNKGIANSRINATWFGEYLRDLNINGVQKMAEDILNEAIENDFGITDDDMMVVVAKVVKKNNKKE